MFNISISDVMGGKVKTKEDSNIAVIFVKFNFLNIRKKMYKNIVTHKNSKKINPK